MGTGRKTPGSGASRLYFSTTPFWSVHCLRLGVARRKYRARSLPGGTIADQIGGHMSKNPVLDLPLAAVMRQEIALPLQHVLQLYTVGSLLKAWRNPKNHRGIEQVFDTPEQARNAVAVCANWLGVQTLVAHEPVPAWWPGDERVPVGA